jgi:predicted SnoaL-like aldol condensation-catalyzing enzyme
MEAGGMGGMMQYPDSKEDAARKEVVQNFGALIDAGKVDEAFEKYVSKDYVEHAYTPRRMSGQDKMGYNEIKPFFEKFMVRAPGDTSKLVEIMVVNDELVTYNGRKGQDIFRVANGKITDHWDTIHQGAGGSPAAAK